MDLPRFILLKSNANNKFLCYTKGKDNHSLLRFSYQANDWKAAKNPREEKKADDDESDKMGFHHLKFEVEKAKTVEGLVHIRSCYNNKYWAWKSVDNKYIAAVANEAEEDQSKWSCTLFKPIFLADVDTSGAGDADLLPLCKAFKIRLVHVSESGQRSVRTSSSKGLDGDSGLLLAESSDVDTSDSTDDVAFTAFDVEATAILPEYAAFMGYNDKYLVRNSPVLMVYLGFEFSASDIGEQGVAQRVTSTVLPQPTSIFDEASNRDWYCYPGLNYIILLPDSFPRGTLFAPVKVGDHIALKCMDNNCFVNSDGTEDPLVAKATTITEKAMLRVAEPVRVREIIDATYDLADSRIYGANSIEKFSDSRSNYTDVEQEGSFQVEYNTEQKMTWTNSTTVNIGIKVSWSAGIPVIGTFGVDISYEHDQTWTSGEENTTGKKITYTQNIRIPPGKKVTMKVISQKAYCDVPYTCKVRDLMTDGTLREYTMTNGLYSGCNEFDFDTKLYSEDL